MEKEVLEAGKLLETLYVKVALLKDEMKLTKDSSKELHEELLSKIDVLFADAVNNPVIKATFHTEQFDKPRRLIGGIQLLKNAPMPMRLALEDTYRTMVLKESIDVISKDRADSLFSKEALDKASKVYDEFSKLMNDYVNSKWNSHKAFNNEFPTSESFANSSTEKDVDIMLEILGNNPTWLYIAGGFTKTGYAILPTVMDEFKMLSTILGNESALQMMIMKKGLK